MLNSDLYNQIEIVSYENFQKMLRHLLETLVLSFYGKKGNTNSTVNSRFKKDLKLQTHLHKAFFSDDQFLDSLHNSFLNQTTLDLRKEKWTFLNREFTVLNN